MEHATTAMLKAFGNAATNSICSSSQCDFTYNIFPPYKRINQFSEVAFHALPSHAKPSETGKVCKAFMEAYIMISISDSYRDDDC
jgi:hypothetical protein